MSSLPKAFLTPEEYLEIERKAETKSEYYAGHMFPMSGGGPSGGRTHSRLQVQLIALLHPVIARGCELYGSDMRVLVEASGFYTYPDVTVVRGEPTFDDTEVDTLTNPALVVEVLSRSTEKHDLTSKRDHYRRIPSLQECLFVRHDTAAVELHRRHEDESWAVLAAAGMDAVVQLESIAFTLVLADLYRGILPDSSSLDPPPVSTLKFPP